MEDSNTSDGPSPNFTLCEDISERNVTLAFLEKISENEINFKLNHYTPPHEIRTIFLSL
jgi:hypothetical protein